MITRHAIINVFNATFTNYDQYFPDKNISPRSAENKYKVNYLAL